MFVNRRHGDRGRWLQTFGTLLDEFCTSCDVATRQWNTPTRPVPQRHQTSMIKCPAHIAAICCRKVRKLVTGVIGREALLKLPKAKRAMPWQFCSASFRV